MSKQGTITLSYRWLNKDAEIGDPPEKLWRYRVEKITDSVSYEPMQMLTKSEVAQLCSSEAWKVTIVPAT